VFGRGVWRLRWSKLFGIALVPAFGSCAFVLDFDELGSATDRDASVGSGGDAGSGGGSDASTGGSGATGASGGSGATGSGGTAGAGAADSGPQAVPLTELAGRLADAVCTGLEACMGPAIELLTLGEDCRGLFGTALQDAYVASIARSIEAGAITYDPVLGAACLQRLLDDVSKTPPACADLNGAVESCKSALGGLANANEPCNSAFECGAGLACDTSVACPGLCRPLARLDEPCRTNNQCDSRDGLYCKLIVDDAGTETGRCATLLPIGAACTRADTCEPGAMCLGDACRRLSDVFTAREGFACGYADGSSLCVPGLFCEFAGFGFGQATCVQEKTPGAACKFSLPDACPAGHYCSVNLLNTGGQCLALPGETQPCAANPMQAAGFAPPCASGLVCVNGLCQTRRRLGDSCGITEQCYSGFCANTGTANACAPPMCP
jgi:hypothetical protein